MLRSKKNSLNFCGIKERLNYPELQEIIPEHDVLCFQRTKTDDLDERNIEGSEIILNNRIRYGIVNSEEKILAFIRGNLSRFIIINATESQTVLWFKIS